MPRGKTCSSVHVFSAFCFSSVDRGQGVGAAIDSGAGDLDSYQCYPRLGAIFRGPWNDFYGDGIRERVTV